MATANDARNALITTLNALLAQATLVAGNPTASQAAITLQLTNALLALEGSATLDSTIVATVNAAITNFNAASTANGNSLSTATTAVNNALSTLQSYASALNSIAGEVTSLSTLTTNLAALKTELDATQTTVNDTNAKAVSLLTNVAAVKAELDTVNTTTAATGATATSIKSDTSSVVTSMSSLSGTAKRNLFGMGMGRAHYHITEGATNSGGYIGAASSYPGTMSVKATVYDARNSTTYILIEQPTAVSAGRPGTNPNSTQLVLLSHTAGVFTVVRNFGNPCGDTTYFADQIYLLPLARSATDSTPVVSVVMWLCNANGLAYSPFTNFYVYNADDNFATGKGAYSSLNSPSSRGCMGYDYTNKTFIFLSNENSSTYCVGGNIKELFAGGTFRATTATYTGTGSAGFYNLVSTTPSRFFNFNGPQTSSDTNFGVNPEWRMLNTVSALNQGYIWSWQYSANTTNMICMRYDLPHWDGSMRFYAHTYQTNTGGGYAGYNYISGRSYYNNYATTINIVPVDQNTGLTYPLGFRLPTWNISATGAVAKYTIHYAPQTTPTHLPPNTASTYTIAGTMYSYVINSCRFSLVDNNGVVLRTGEVPTSALGPLAFVKELGQAAVTQGTRGTAAVGLYHPIAYDLGTDDAIMLFGHKGQEYTYSNEVFMGTCLLQSIKMV